MNVFRVARTPGELRRRATPDQPQLKYRPDIDGLRAVAVLAVLLFHAGLPGFSGGYLGVDVFFVISGFLITSILVRQAQKDGVSVIAFYNRRIRRIFPALFATLIGVTAAGALLLAPQAFHAYGQSVAATTLFSSNFLFWHQTGYFATNALEKPLLHTWSLAVEEQFYLVWPLLLGAFFRFGLQKHLLKLLCGGVVASFMLCALWPDKSAVFYFPITRAWELGLGALLAVRPVRLPAWMSFVAILAILGAVVECGRGFPLFIAAAFACGGTAILLCTQEAPVNRVLSTRPFVGIGLISYSLYLWHWPLLAFARYTYSDVPPLSLRLGLLAVSGVLAYLSYRFVEVPLRKAQPTKSPFAAAAAIMALLIGIGLAIVLTHGFPKRYGNEVASAEGQFNILRPCNGCKVGHGPPYIFLWGDSQAMAVQPAVSEFVQKRRVGGIFFTRSACPPLIGAHIGGDTPCGVFQRRAAATIRKTDPDVILLVARWSISSETTVFPIEGKRREYLTDSKTQAQTVQESRRALTEGLFRTVQFLTKVEPQAKILLIGQPPDLGLDAERCMIAVLRAGECQTVPRASLDRLAFSENLLANVAARFPNVTVIDLKQVLCRANRCPTHIGDQFIYRDATHITKGGAKLLLEPSLLRLQLR